MRDIEVFIEALRIEANWCEMDDDRITCEIGYRLRRVAERFEEKQSENMRQLQDAERARLLPSHERGEW